MTMWVLDAATRMKRDELTTPTTTPASASKCQYATGYTVIEIPGTLKAQMSASTYLAVMRNLDVFERNTLLLDDGQ